MLNMLDKTEIQYMPEIKSVVIEFSFLNARFRGVVKVHGNWFYGHGDFLNLKDELLNQDEYISGCIFDKKCLYINFLKNNQVGFAVSYGELMVGNVYNLESFYYDYNGYATYEDEYDEYCEYYYDYSACEFDKNEIGDFSMISFSLDSELDELNRKLNSISNRFPEYNSAYQRLKREGDLMEYLRIVEQKYKVKKLED